MNFKRVVVAINLALFTAGVFIIRHMRSEIKRLRYHNEALTTGVSSNQLTKGDLTEFNVIQSELPKQVDDRKRNPQVQHGHTCWNYEPSNEYEVSRRSAIRDVVELSNYLKGQLQLLSSSSDNHTIETLERVIYLADAHKRSILHYLQRLKEVDGGNEWRKKEEEELSNVIQRRLTHVQNPKNCAEAKKVLCWFKSNGCGYACQMHHLVYCLSVAYATGRTLVLNMTGWNYGAGLYAFYEPISDNCKDYDLRTIVDWPGSPSSMLIRLPLIGAMASRPPFLPLAVPKDISKRAARLYGDPAAWWIGQLFKFVLKPTKKFKEIIQKKMANLGFQPPVVGVHVRRTDKKRESAYYELGLYMEHVEAFYQQLELNDSSVVRRVFLATDESTVLQEAQQRFKSYIFLTNPNSTKVASTETTRYTAEGELGIALDIYFLSRSNYLVCTFSSNICRMAYTIMQSLSTEAWNSFRSLDDVFYFSSQKSHYHVAIYSYDQIQPAEITLQPGDDIEVLRNLWNGYCVGKNVRTKQTGQFPCFMVVDVVDAVDMPNYS